MYFREFYAKQADLQALQHYHPAYHEHFTWLERAQSSQRYSRIALWLGKRLESWGQMLQSRYSHVPRLAQK